MVQPSGMALKFPVKVNLMSNRVLVAISGKGRTLQNLIANQEHFDYTIAAVVSSSESCQGNQIAHENNIPLFVGEFSKSSIEQTTKALVQFTEENNISWIALAGFLKPFPVMNKFKDKIVNIHPALLPNYGGKGMYGMNVHKAVFQAGDQESGATIHFVTDKYDEGRIISQAKVDISKATSAQEIADEVFTAECKLYPQTLHNLILKSNS